MVSPPARITGFTPDGAMNSGWLAFLLLFLGVLLLVLALSWRWKAGGLAIQYLGLFWLVQPHWPLAVAAVALISGWMAALVLAITLATLPPPESGNLIWPGGRFFRLLTISLVVLVTFALALRLADWLMIALPVAWGSLLLSGTGLLLLGLSQQDLDISLGLLTTLAGFEVLYASLETSTLVVALLALIHLGMSLTAAYLLSLKGAAS